MVESTIKKEDQMKAKKEKNMRINNKRIGVIDDGRGVRTSWNRLEKVRIGE